MRSRLAWVAGGIGVGAALVYGFVRRGLASSPVDTVDPRADELRSRIAESREIVDEREEFEGGETPVDRAEPVQTEPVDVRRRHVHERGRATIDRMQRSEED